MVFFISGSRLAFIRSGMAIFVQVREENNGLKRLASDREVTNKSTGWAFARPVKTCPSLKMAHPLNYLAHRKMGTTIM